jgi:hypothetical protein
MPGTLHEDQDIFWSYLTQFFLENKMLQTKSCTENRITHFIFNNFFVENRAVYEIPCKSVVERSRPQMTICRMRLACWIPKGTNTHSQYVILIAFPLQQWLHEPPQCYGIRTLPVCWTFVLIILFLFLVSIPHFIFRRLSPTPPIFLVLLYLLSLW